MYVTKVYVMSIMAIQSSVYAYEGGSAPLQKVVVNSKFQGSAPTYIWCTALSVQGYHHLVRKEPPYNISSNKCMEFIAKYALH